LERERLELLEKTVNRMPLPERNFIRDCIVDEFNVETYAAAHGCSEQSVYIRRSRVMKKLVGILGQGTS
jgi:DNA-directed RNA polymerase specialized sigma24 family protein